MLQWGSVPIKRGVLISEGVIMLQWGSVPIKRGVLISEGVIMLQWGSVPIKRGVLISEGVMYRFLGPEDVSLVERCPHFRGCYVQALGFQQHYYSGLEWSMCVFLFRTHFQLAGTCLYWWVWLQSAMYYYMYCLPAWFKGQWLQPECE